MYPEEEVLDDALRRISQLEEIVDELTQRLRQAQTWDQVNVAGGIAYNELHGGS